MRYEEKIVSLKDGRSCVFRSPEASDAVVMLRYLQQTAAETQFMIRTPAEAGRIELAAEEKMLSYLCDDERSMMIAAFFGGEALGNVGVQCVNDRLKMRHRASMGVAVRKAYWGKGIGSLLIREALQEAKRMGYTQMELGVFADNERAIGLYQRMGFEIWGRTKNAFRIEDGVMRDEILMGKLL